MQGLYRGRRFKALVVRELRELAPYPGEAQARMNWWDHLRRQFVHPRMFANTCENRDFILSLDPALVYHVTQLWFAFTEHDARSWLHYLGRCAGYDRSGDVSRAHASWGALLREYSTLDSSAV